MTASGWLAVLEVRGNAESMVDLINLLAWLWVILRLHILLHYCHLADDLIQSDLQKWRTSLLVSGLQKCDIKKALKASL